MKTINFKLTTWESVTVPDDQEEKIIALIKDGTITESGEIPDYLDEDTDMDREDFDLECTRQMLVEDNDGESTIEVRDEDGKIVWENGE